MPRLNVVISSRVFGDPSSTSTSINKPFERSRNRLLHRKARRDISTMSPNDSDPEYLPGEASTSTSDPQTSAPASQGSTRTKHTRPDSSSKITRKKKRRRRYTKPYANQPVNVYAASASLLTISGRPLSPKHRVPAAADEILFHNRKDPRWKIPDEVDMKIRDREVLDRLPDSDLLKAVHSYTSEFFAARGWEKVGVRMMDEGALLAIGCVLEEWCKEMVGKQGDLVFVDKEEDI